MGLKKIFRYIGLASKVYCLQTACCHDFDKHRGESCNSDKNTNFVEHIGYSEKIVMKSVSNRAQASFTFDNYLSCLQSQIPTQTVDYRIISKRQKLSTVCVQKIAMTGFCDKRFIKKCGIHSYPYCKENSFDCTAEECTN